MLIKQADQDQLSLNPGQEEEVSQLLYANARTGLGNISATELSPGNSVLKHGEVTYENVSKRNCTIAKVKEILTARK